MLLLKQHCVDFLPSQDIFKNIFMIHSLVPEENGTTAIGAAPPAGLAQSYMTWVACPATCLALMQHLKRQQQRLSGGREEERVAKQKDAGQASTVMQFYTRPVEGAVTMAGVSF